MNATDMINANALMASVQSRCRGVGTLSGVGTGSPLGSQLFLYRPKPASPSTPISSMPTATVVKSGTSTLTLAATGANSYAGLVIDQGTVTVSNSAALASGAAVTLNGNGATLNLTGVCQRCLQQPAQRECGLLRGEHPERRHVGQCDLNNGSLIVNNNTSNGVTTFSGLVSGGGGLIVSGYNGVT